MRIKRGVSDWLTVGDGVTVGSSESERDAVGVSVGDALSLDDGLGEADGDTDGDAEIDGVAETDGEVDGDGDRSSSMSRTTHSGGSPSVGRLASWSSTAIGASGSSDACALGIDKVDMERPIAVTATNTERMPGLPSIPSPSWPPTP